MASSAVVTMAQRTAILFLSRGLDTELRKLPPELQVSGHDLQCSLTHS